MGNINLSMKFQISGGPGKNINKSKSIEAYDKIEIEIPPGTADMSVAIQPSDAEKVSFLLITSSLYDAQLNYKVNDGDATDSDPITLDEPHLYLGKGMIDDLLGIDPKVLKFTNSNPVPAPPDATKTAKIEILVGRDVTS